MTRILLLTALILPLAGCADLNLFQDRDDGPRRPVPRPEIIEEIPEDAREVEEFDTTSTEEREEALGDVTTESVGDLLGTTIASLGDPTEQGFWLKTPLVSEITQGRVVYEASGVTVRVELRPSEAAGGGSQISLAAMRLLGVALTALPELSVYLDNGA